MGVTEDGDGSQGGQGRLSRLHAPDRTGCGGPSAAFRPFRRQGLCLGHAVMRLPPGRASGGHCSPPAFSGPSPTPLGAHAQDRCPLAPVTLLAQQLLSRGDTGAQVNRAAIPVALTVVTCWTPR